jgi:hypothetical protein
MEKGSNVASSVEGEGDIQGRDQLVQCCSFFIDAFLVQLLVVRVSDVPKENVDSIFLS